MKDVVQSYKGIRQTIGALGILLPALIYFHTGFVGHCWCLQDTISHYFYTTGNVFFEGILWILGIVLMYYPAYKGEKGGDSLLTCASGIFAWGVALIPTNSNSADSCAMFHIPDSAVRNHIHLACAGLMLLTFSFMSIWLFTRSNPANYNIDNPKHWKNIRNAIYVACGIVTAASIVAIVVLMQMEKYMKHFPFSNKYTFWLEVSSIVPFGISWLVKGGFIFTDKHERSTVGHVAHLFARKGEPEKQEGQNEPQALDSNR